MYSIDEIIRLATAVSENKLEKIAIKTEEGSLTIVGHSAPPMPPMMPQTPQMNTMPAAIQPIPEPTVCAAAEAPAKAETGKTVTAPIVGTFYASPSPDQDAFVKVGDTVKKGDVLMIIESMKLMNEVTSDFDGVVREILVTSGTGVEYGQPIMILD